MHCWTGRAGKRDRPPTGDELITCRVWWTKEINLLGLTLKVIVLLGRPATEAFARIHGCSRSRSRSRNRNRSRSRSRSRSFKDLLEYQGEEVIVGDRVLRRFVLPHPVASYPGKTDLYGEVFGEVGRILGGAATFEKLGHTDA